MKMIRDEIAQIIDPDAFEDAMLQDDLTPSERLYFNDARQTNKATALGKADAVLAILGPAATPASDPDEPREVTPHWQRRWPHDQPNGWNLDSAGFLKLIQENPLMWLALGRAKYLEMRIDTRDGGFNLYDRDKKPLNPDDVIEAINKARADFGDPPVSRPHCSPPGEVG